MTGRQRETDNKQTDNKETEEEWQRVRKRKRMRKEEK